MKEFEFTFREGLTKGLRKDRFSSLAEQDLVLLHNWAPTETGLEVHENITLMDVSEALPS